jgi:allantoinase
VAFDPDAEWVVHAGELHHRNPVTPYAGKSVRGAVTTTWLRGQRVTGDQPAGRFLKREDA